MKHLSPKLRTALTIVILLAICIVFYLVGKNMGGTKTSDDPLSTGIGERWGGALPAGFTKTEISTLQDGQGYVFASLIYDEDVAELLTEWEAPPADAQQTLDALLEELKAQPGLTEQQLTQLAELRPTLDSSWIYYRITGKDDPQDVIYLMYHAQDRRMVIAERQQ